MSYKWYAILSTLPLLFLCDVGLGFTNSDLRAIATALICVVLVIAVLAIFVVAGNRPQ